MTVEVYKVLGQCRPAAGVWADLYVVPSGSSALVSAVVAANPSDRVSYVELTCALSGSSFSLEQYVTPPKRVEPNDSPNMLDSYNITPGSTDVLRVRSSTGEVSFNAFGIQIT